MNTTDQLLELCGEIFDVKKDSLTILSKREEIEEWDSLAMVQLIAEIETVFSCKIPMAAITEIEAINDFLQYIEK